jgi:hypothetical protein
MKDQTFMNSNRNGALVAKILTRMQKNDKMPITVTVPITLCFILYNVDETGLAVVNKSGKIIAPKGCKMVLIKRWGGMKT